MLTWLRWPASLWARLLLASLLLLPAFLIVSGYLLEKSFLASQRTAQQSQLQSQAYLLMAAAEWDNENLWLPETLQEPGFNQPDSGLYGFIINGKRELWRSASAQYQLQHWRPSVALDEITPASTGFYEQVIELSSDHIDDIDDITTGDSSNSSVDVAIFYYDTLWDNTDASSSTALRFYVIQDLTQSHKQLQAYRQQMSYSLGALMLTLLLLQLLIVRWGLRPLRVITQELSAIQQGEQAQLKGAYPQEIQPITASLNQVLANEQTQRERYRTTLGDLAHSLKTPLAVIKGELHNVQPENTQATLEDQCSRMNQIIQHQLRRAVAGQKTFADASPVQPLVERLCNALNKVYRDKHIVFEKQIPTDCLFYGTDSDLMEVLGNLLDNACKFCQQHIRASALLENNALIICIEDDGPGVDQNQYQELLARGARADTAYAGQGIGLAVAIDIISSYQGSLTVDKSSLGGARFCIRLQQGR